MRTISRFVIVQQGVSLLEMIVFIVVVSIALGALISVYTQAVRSNADPIVRLRLLEAAQSRLDEVMALKYDENTPTGGVPACVSPDNPCANTSVIMNNVDGFNGVTDEPYVNYQRSVDVTFDAPDGNRKLITVSVTAPDGQTLALSAYRYNF